MIVPHTNTVVDDDSGGGDVRRSKCNRTILSIEATNTKSSCGNSPSQVKSSQVYKNKSSSLAHLMIPSTPSVVPTTNTPAAAPLFRVVRRVLILTLLAFLFTVSTTEAFTNRPAFQNKNTSTTTSTSNQETKTTKLFYQRDGDNNNNNNDNSNNNEIMRAWTCHGKNQRDLVERLRQAGIVKTPAVQKVLERVDRANFIPSNPYMDAPQGIGLGQTISAPHMHAHVMEEIYPYLVGKKEITMLDVGSGSGYLTAALGRWIQEEPRGLDEETPILGSGVTGKVFGIDVHQGLIDLSIQNIRKGDADLLDTGVVKIMLGDGWKGLPSEAPFDAIHVGAAADGMPYELVSQLKVGGVMIIPMGAQTQIQNLYKIERTSANDPVGFDPSDYRIISLLGVRYVPLVHPPSKN